MLLAYYWKRYRADLVPAIANVLAVFFSFFLGATRNYLLACCLVYLVTLEWLIHLGSKPQGIVYLPLNKHSHKRHWSGWGSFELDESEKAFMITGSPKGILCVPTYGWVDYSIKFDFKIVRSCLGVVVRARDLSNLIMLQIFQTGIRPHLRINGFWRIYGEQESALSFEAPMSLDRYYRAEIGCNREVIKIIFRDGESIVFDRSWHIPHDVRVTMTDLMTGRPVEFPFVSDFQNGAVGFRNTSDTGIDEKAFVKNFWVERS